MQPRSKSDISLPAGDAYHISLTSLSRLLWNQLDITSVWETITDLSFDYKVLVSTYNPNRLSFVLQEANVTFGHNGSEVGYWYTNDTWVAQAGSISDVR